MNKATGAPLSLRGLLLLLFVFEKRVWDGAGGAPSSIFSPGRSDSPSKSLAQTVQVIHRASPQ